MLFQVSISHVLVDNREFIAFVAVTKHGYKVFMMNSEKVFDLQLASSSHKLLLSLVFILIIKDRAYVYIPLL